jgi:hypothetical protein
MVAVRRPGREIADVEEEGMMPFQAYQLYEIERPKTAAEVRRADERAGRTAAAVAGMLRRFTSPRQRQQQARPMDRTLVCDRMNTTMEVR